MDGSDMTFEQFTLYRQISLIQSSEEIFLEFIPKSWKCSGIGWIPLPKKTTIQILGVTQQAGCSYPPILHSSSCVTWVIFSKALDKSPSSMASAAASNASVMMLLGRKWALSLGSIWLVEKFQDLQMWLWWAKLFVIQQKETVAILDEKRSLT